MKDDLNNNNNGRRPREKINWKTNPPKKMEGDHKKNERQHKKTEDNIKINKREKTSTTK
jgi:hypothetical protein